MKTIRINFKYFCAGFDPEDNFFTNLLRRKYDVVISENPDYMLYSVYPEKSIKNVAGIGRFIKKISPELYMFMRKVFSKSMSLFTKNKKLKGNFIKIFYGAEHVRPNMSECDWAFGSHFEEDIDSPRYMRLLPYLPNDYLLENMGNPPLKKRIDIKKIKKEKTKFCNFIYSQDVPARNGFFKILSKYKRIDSPGRCMNNMPPLMSNDPNKSRLEKNWFRIKLDFIRPYKFTIAFENASKPGWVTEKLTHPMLVNSIPIYFGHKDVEKDFNTKSFINFNDFKNMKEFIEHIIKVDTDDSLYESYLKQPWYKNNQYPKNIHINDKKLMKRFEEIFG